ncbi:hypothetical protein EVAR_8136_1 [Eumeta japonica]|uniref:Uncharacterized protein n=1 Tax=Eumeta variegata TaxID=151549 RepID=A0A4C1TT41_EUMVA|nr:hypothetical protein EVAR_8136_1 [Eumeta japonica]
MSSRDRDAGRKFESAENIPSTSSWVPPPLTLSSQEHESRVMSTSMSAGMENLNPQMTPRLMMELEGGHRNSVIKRRNPIEFGLV